MKEIKYTQPVRKELNLPCLVKNDSGHVFLATYGVLKKDIFVTLVSGRIDEIKTFKCNINFYTPLEAGHKIEFTN
jgi:hypothetical protein